MALASTGRESPECDKRSVYSSIYTCTYEHVSGSSASTSEFASEITSLKFANIVTSAGKCVCLD